LSVRKAWFWLALGWTAMIAVLCLVSFSELPHVKLANIDKAVHATFHFVFTLLWYAYSCERFPDIPAWQRRWRIVAASIVYGCTIEVAQSLFTTTREGDVTDVMANTAGALLAIGLIWLAGRKRPA
jgi:VanZ family protein